MSDPNALRETLEVWRILSRVFEGQGHSKQASFQLAVDTLSGLQKQAASGVLDSIGKWWEGLTPGQMSLLGGGLGAVGGGLYDRFRGREEWEGDPSWQSTLGHALAGGALGAGAGGAYGYARGQSDTSPEHSSSNPNARDEDGKTPFNKTDSEKAKIKEEGRKVKQDNAFTDSFTPSPRAAAIGAGVAGAGGALATGRALQTGAMSFFPSGANALANAKALADAQAAARAKAVADAALKGLDAAKTIAAGDAAAASATATATRGASALARTGLLSFLPYGIEAAQYAGGGQGQRSAMADAAKDRSLGDLSLWDMLSSTSSPMMSMHSGLAGLTGGAEGVVNAADLHKIQNPQTQGPMSGMEQALKGLWNAPGQMSGYYDDQNRASSQSIQAGVSRPAGAPRDWRSRDATTDDIRQRAEGIRHRAGELTGADAAAYDANNASQRPYWMSMTGRVTNPDLAREWFQQNRQGIPWDQLQPRDQELWHQLYGQGAR